MKIFNSITTWVKNQRTHYILDLQEDATPQEAFDIGKHIADREYHYGQYLGIDKGEYDKLPDNMKRHYKKVVHDSIPMSRFYNIATGVCVVLSLISTYMYGTTSKGQWIVVSFAVGVGAIMLYLSNLRK